MQIYRNQLRYVGLTNTILSTNMLKCKKRSLLFIIYFVFYFLFNFTSITLNHLILYTSSYFSLFLKFRLTHPMPKYTQ